MAAIPGIGGGSGTPPIPGSGGGRGTPLIPGSGGGRGTPPIPGRGGGRGTPLIPGRGGGDTSPVSGRGGAGDTSVTIDEKETCASLLSGAGVSEDEWAGLGDETCVSEGRLVWESRRRVVSESGGTMSESDLGRTVGSFSATGEG